MLPAVPRYDDASHTLSVAHDQYDGIHAIAFSRSDPRILYFGLAVEHLREAQQKE